MKKNVMMRVASALLIAVLLTTCAISGTFAKYVSEGTSTDTARVAKWGVKIETTGGMFGQKYYKNGVTNGDKAAEASVTTDLSVANISDDNKNVLAPGTKGELAASTITGTPEVSVKIDYSATLTLNDWKDSAGNDYFPLIITVNGVTYGLTGIKDSAGNLATQQKNSIDDLKSAVVQAIADCSAEYDANTNLETQTVKISWEWAFESGDDNDAKDTFLGNNSTLASIEFQLKTTVTQLD